MSDTPDTPEGNPGEPMPDFKAAIHRGEFDDKTAPKAAPAAAADTQQDFCVFLVTKAPKSVDELTAKLAEVTKAVVETGKRGSLTYTVTIRPASKDGMADMLLIEDKVSATVPKAARDPLAVMWADEAGGLLDHPSNQQTFDFGSSK